MYLITNTHYEKHVLHWKLFNSSEEAEQYAIQVLDLHPYSFIIKPITL
jgi:hypothetical protein